MLEIPEGEEPVQVPTGPPRVTWIDVEGYKPVTDMLPPDQLPIRVVEVTTIPTKDGQGHVYISYCVF